MDTDAIWNHIALLWYCNKCNLWWVSEPTGQPHTWVLIRLAEPVLDPAWKTRCPGWAITGPDPSICPECLTKMVTQPGKRQRISAIFQPRPEILALFN